ncbi:MAG TPA: FxLYD domain-containing protein [Bryobacteraceae bacterium]|nr:FxLYD domain-containing protein [Bryobacteraceae bacterium]HVW09516.1 FxLYD domain-containing protein [Bryobacteraceae bacterium]
MERKNTLLYIFAGLVTLGVAAAAYLHYSPGSSGAAPLTPEAKAYVHNLKMGPVEMKATDSYVNQTITEIEGTITNGGDRTIRSVDIYCYFYDAYGQLVLRERASIVKPGRLPFQPRDTRNYRLAFDNIPASWNNHMPQLVIAQILFE